MPDTNGVVERALSELEEDRYSSNAGISVAHVLQALPILEKNDSLATLEMTLHRQRIMILHKLTWQWLQQVVQHHVPLADTSTSPPSHWVEFIAYQFHLLVIASTQSAVIQPPDCLKVLPGCSEPYGWTLGRRRLFGNDTQRHQYVITQVLKVLQFWLRYPPASEPQAVFLSQITTAAGGDDILLIEEVWQSFRHVKTHVLGNHKITRVKGSHFEPFVAALQSHPITDCTSKERVLLKSIGDLFRTFQKNHSSCASHSIENLDFNLRLSSLTDNLDSTDFPSSNRLEVYVEIPIKSSLSKKRSADDFDGGPHPKRTRRSVAFTPHLSVLLAP